VVLNMNIHIIILDVQYYDDCCMPICDARNIIGTVCADKKGGNRYVAGNRTLYYYYYYYASKDAHFVKLPSYPFLQFWAENRKKYSCRRGTEKRNMKNRKSRKPRFLFSLFPSYFSMYSRFYSCGLGWKFLVNNGVTTIKP